MYRLRPRGSVAHEVKRIADKQLGLAIEELRTVSTPAGDNAVHEARRHIKKVRALLALVRPAMGDTYVSFNRRLRMANRQLAPIADGRAVVGTLGRLSRRPGAADARATLASVRTALVQRVTLADRKALFDRVLPRVATMLSVERARMGNWSLNARGSRAIAPGLADSVRRARKAMVRAVAHPTAGRYHAWRRRTKDLWFHVRLIEGRCRCSLAPLRRRLEALDGCLGEYHNVVLLEAVLAAEAISSRHDTARALRLLRAYQAELGDRSLALGALALEESPRRFVRRIRKSWDAGGARARGVGGRSARWPHAA